MPKRPAEAPKTAKALRPVRLRCEYLEDPAAVGPERPRLSWAYRTTQERGVLQSAWRILVASSPDALRRGEGDLWDSGRVESDAQGQIRYGGAPLAPMQEAFWKVRVWDQAGRPSPWSAPARWAAGLGPQDWRAKWIGYDAPRKAAGQAAAKKAKAVRILPPPRCLRRDLDLPEKPLRARLYVAALGLVDFRINGRRVDDAFFRPGWTNYHKRVPYDCHDVTDLLEAGENALGAVLADGWYAGFLGFNFEDLNKSREHYGSNPRLFAQLELEYADGRRDRIVTDRAWRAAEGPLREADLQMGETYDARRERDGWDRPGFQARGWKPVQVAQGPGAALEPRPAPPVRRYAEHRPRSIKQPAAGRWVFDFGTNFAGFVRLAVRGAGRGRRIVLRFGERLNPDGTLYTENLRGARATDTYVCRGGGEEVWEPRFTFHGFQYCEIENLPGKPTKSTAAGVELTADAPEAGRFRCSDAVANQLYRNIRQTQRANFIEVPTDCPQRDERLGWTGDAQIYMATACMNNDLAAFFTKWLIDLDDDQLENGAYPNFAPQAAMPPHGGAGAWADAGVICPWRMYETYGDEAVLRRNWPGMKRFMEFCANDCREDKPFIRKAWGFGDWLSIQAHTPPDLLNTAYYAHSADLMGRIARVLGKDKDARRFDALFESVRKAFIAEFYERGSGRLRGDTQTGYVLALAFDLAEGDARERLARRLVENLWERGWRLSTGFVGAKDLMNVLTKIGRTDVAYRLFHSEEFPGWGFSIRCGATSIWERWDGWTPEKGFQTPSMNSFAHYSFGAVGEWMFTVVAGIASAAPAWERVRIQPRPGGTLRWVEASHDCPRGQVAVRWERRGKALALDVTLPPNCRAEIHVPAARPGVVSESGRKPAAARGVKYLRMEDGAAVYEAGAGGYAFLSRDAALDDA